jgi:hypothetical protein
MSRVEPSGLLRAFQALVVACLIGSAIAEALDSGGEAGLGGQDTHEAVACDGPSVAPLVCAYASAHALVSCYRFLDGGVPGVACVGQAHWNAVGASYDLDLPGELTALFWGRCSLDCPEAQDQPTAIASCSWPGVLGPLGAPSCHASLPDHTFPVVARTSPSKVCVHYSLQSHTDAWATTPGPVILGQVRTSAFDVDLGAYCNID